MATNLPSSKRSLAGPRHDLPGLRNFARIAAGLYRGGQPTAEGFATLREMGIRTVVNLRAYHTDRPRVRGMGLNYVHLFWRAWLPRDRQIAMFLSLVRDPAHQPVFVHCLHGSDRTGIAVAAYRVIVEQWSAADAGAELHAFGNHRVFPQIRHYLRRLNAGLMAERLASAARPRVQRIT